MGNRTQCLGRVLQKIDVEMSFHGCIYLGGRQGSPQTKLQNRVTG
jgi:hypothetical protein